LTLPIPSEGWGGPSGLHLTFGTRQQKDELESSLILTMLKLVVPIIMGVGIGEQGVHVTDRGLIVLFFGFFLLTPPPLEEA